MYPLCHALLPFLSSCVLWILPNISSTDWIESIPGLLYQSIVPTGTQHGYRIYKVSGSYDPSLQPPLFCPCSGDIIISLQDSTVHWVDNSGVSHSWEGNCGENQLWNKRVLAWNGSNLSWTPSSIWSRHKKNPSIHSLGVKAIVDAIISPVHPKTQLKRKILDQSLPTSQPTKSQKLVYGSNPQPEISLLESSPEPAVETMDDSIPEHLQGEQLRPIFHSTHDTSWTSQSCISDTIGEYPEDNKIQEWRFNGLKTISPIHETV